MASSDQATESVWEYPRPPALEESNQQVRVEFNGEVIADTRNAKRVLETSHPPTYYIPPEDVNSEFLKESDKTTLCEWKGTARYFDVVVGDKRAGDAAWYYPDPTERFESIENHLAFYPGKMDACYVGEEQVKAQESSFYGGWITSNITGPFKGDPGITKR